MPKPANLIPSKQLNVALPLPLFTQLSLHLSSDLEGRVPHGAYSRFLSDLLRAHFERAEIDLNTYMSQVPPGVYVLSGPSVSVDAFQKLLSVKVQA